MRYPDYREMSVRLTMNGQEIEIQPKVDTAHVADADDAIFEDFFYYDGQCEPEYRGIPFRDPVREQPPGQDFSMVPIHDPEDATAPDVAMMEPLAGAAVTSPVRLFYHVADAGLSGAAGADILLNGEPVRTKTSEVPVVLELAPGDYRWQVIGWDRAGNRGATEERQFTVLAEAAHPTPVVLTDVQKGDGKFAFSFQTIEGLNYLVEKTTGGLSWDFLLRTNASTNIVRVVEPTSGGEGKLFRVRTGE